MLLCQAPFCDTALNKKWIVPVQHCTWYYVQQLCSFIMYNFFIVLHLMLSWEEFLCNIITHANIRTHTFPCVPFLVCNLSLYEWHLKHVGHAYYQSCFLSAAMSGCVGSVLLSVSVNLLEPLYSLQQHHLLSRRKPWHLRPAVNHKIWELEFRRMFPYL